MIAREKASIAKPGAPLVLGEIPEEARRAVVEVASAAGCARIVTAEPLPDGVAVGLAGPHQRRNAAVARTVAREIGLTDDAIARGLRAASWPGRLESIVTPGGRFLLDGAHNPEGAVALARALEVEPPGAIVFGALGDKDWRGMLAALAAVPAPRFYVAPGGRTPADPQALAAAHPGTPCASLEEGLALARCAAGEGTVVICGSLYLVGAARARLLGLTPDAIVAL